MSPKQDNVTIRIELFKETDGRSGYTFTMDGLGGCGYGGMDHLTALMKAYQLVRKEVRRVIETREEKTQRMAKRKEALRRSKDKGLI